MEPNQLPVLLVIFLRYTKSHIYHMYEVEPRNASRKVPGDGWWGVGGGEYMRAMKI